MKYLMIILCSCFAFTAKSQDFSYAKTDTAKIKPAILKQKPQTPVATPLYRDTRLGSSSPLYNTYQKNDNGAGAITTNPNKSGGVIPISSEEKTIDSAAAKLTPEKQIYRDTRLGSSSPLYNTYEKNKEGAGAVTTNPIKQ
ncbi:MAG: hypothetical protein KIT66_03125 [Chitinophagaceae bacterium]|nr:hypothetical protein [Chitinophagaceae bacterium]